MKSPNLPLIDSCLWQAAQLLPKKPRGKGSRKANRPRILKRKKAHFVDLLPFPFAQFVDLLHFPFMLHQQFSQELLWEKSRQCFKKSMHARLDSSQQDVDRIKQNQARASNQPNISTQQGTANMPSLLFFDGQMSMMMLNNGNRSAGAQDSDFENRMKQLLFFKIFQNVWPCALDLLLLPQFHAYFWHYSLLSINTS